MPPAADDPTRFGVLPEDEGPHPFDPDVEWWNESWFWDWFDAEGRRAGHCRIGVHPNQGRFWVWFYAWHDGEWLVLEEPRLPLADLDLARLAYDGWGLRFSWDAEEPLERGRFRFEGSGRAVSGPRTGQVLPVGADLEVTSLGVPHSMGRGTAAGHRSETYSTSRVEQPVAYRGALQVGDERAPFEGRGERDHSWGPRHWNMDWTFLVLNGDAVRMQCAVAEIPGAGRFPGGYLLREQTRSLSEVRFDVSLDEANVLDPVRGRFQVKTEDGDTFGGEIEALTGAQIDISHTFVPPQPSLYRRALVRVHPDDGSPPSLGWLEFNRLPRAEG